jgi:hypothetical protein
MLFYKIKSSKRIAMDKPWTTVVLHSSDDGDAGKDV